jgi:signal transduction histidine kinase
VLLASLAPAAALAGVARRSRGEAIDNRAARQVIAETLVEHTARGERARIARELHDVVAHHISMVVVQAETARVATPGMPAAGAQRFAAIGDTARAALTEMRRLLGVLREDASAVAAELRPQPGLTQLNDLLDEAREAAGTGARLIVSGPPAALDPGVELAAYRIVQEALTNARRHAPGAAVDVELRYTAETLRVRIRDNGPGPDDRAGRAGAERPGGHGLPGMRERAAAVGGRLRTGPAAGGGFLVEATLPAKAGELA